MTDNNPETPDTPIQRRTKEFEDPHYHDEDEAAPGEEKPASRPSRPSPRRKLPPRPRRRFESE